MLIKSNIGPFTRNVINRVDMWYNGEEHVNYFISTEELPLVDRLVLCSL